LSELRREVVVRDLAVGTRGRVADGFELHDVLDRVEVAVVLRAGVEQLGLLTDLVLREVDDHLVALGHPVAEARHVLRRVHEAAVGADDGERLAGAQADVVAAREAGRSAPFLANIASRMVSGTS
jgi:hypothetical protein